MQRIPLLRLRCCTKYKWCSDVPLHQMQEVHQHTKVQHWCASHRLYGGIAKTGAEVQFLSNPSFNCSYLSAYTSSSCYLYNYCLTHKFWVTTNIIIKTTDSSSCVAMMIDDDQLWSWNHSNQRCQKRQIWQIYLCYFFQSGANFVVRFTDRNGNREYSGVRSVLWPLWSKHRSDSRVWLIQ